MKLDFYTITIGDETFDLPKDMPVPERGSVIFLADKVGVVDTVKYHIIGKKVNMISIYATKR